MSDFLNSNNSRPTRLLLRSDTITNWLSANSTPLMYGEVGIGFDPNSNSVIAKVGSIKENTGQRWADAPQIGAEVDELGIDLENVGRIYSSVVVDQYNKPINTFNQTHFYPECSNNITHLYGDFSQLPYSLRCGTDQSPPDGTILSYDCVISPRRNYILPKNISGWRTTLSVNTSNEIPTIFEAPVGFVHPEFDNVIPCNSFGVLNKLPIQPIQTPISVLSWIENVEVWTIPISPIADQNGRGNYAMKFLGTVSGWFPFPHREFICDIDPEIKPTDGYVPPQINCSITLDPSSDADVDTDSSTTDIVPGSAGTGEFSVSASDPDFSCDQYPEYCSNTGICGACINWSALVIQGGDWFRLTEIVRNVSDCEPSTGTIKYEFDANYSQDPAERTAKVRVFMGTSIGSSIPVGTSYADFTFNQSQPFCEVVNVLPSGTNVPTVGDTKVFSVRMLYGKCSFIASESTITGSSASYSWFSISNPEGGYSGNAENFAVVVDSNVGSGSNTSARTGYIKVQENGGETGNFKIVRISQTGNICEVETMTPETQSVPVSGGNYTVDVEFNTLDEVCTWTALVENIDGNFDSDNKWVLITQNASGTGSEIISYSVEQNPSIQNRECTISVLDKDINITQNAKPCFIEQVLDPDTLTNNSMNLTGCGDDEQYFYVKPYTCTTEDGCLEQENCQWKVDLTHLTNNYPWINILGVGNTIDNLLPASSVITGYGVVKYSVTPYLTSGDGELCPQSPRIGQIYIDLHPNQLSNPADAIFNVLQNCTGECVCTPEGEGCGGEQGPCRTNPPTGCAYGYGQNGEECQCFCEDGASFPDSETGLCPENPPSCFANDGSGGPSPGGGSEGTGTGEGEGPGSTPCGVATWTKIYEVDTDGQSLWSPIDWGLSFVTQSSGIIEGFFGVYEIERTKVANTFVKIKGYLNPGVSPVWNAQLNTWEPKYVPNFYSNEFQSLQGDGFVYWNITSKRWELTNIIDGGTSGTVVD